MQIGVISDTHGHLRGTQDAVRMLESLQVEAVLHCGDIGTPEVVACLRPWPTHFVFGNTDHDHLTLREAIESCGLVCHGEYGEIVLGQRRIALLHGHDQRLLKQTIEEEQHDLVCSGHTHVAEVVRRGRTLVLNPGAIYRASPHTIAVVDLAKMEATIVPL
jgi:uncharacterized protein